MVWFDMGNVLLHFSRVRQGEALRELPGCRRELAEIIPFIDGRSAEHVAYELGELDRETFLTRLASFLGTTAPQEEVEEAYSTLFTPNEPVCQLAAEIAQVLPIGLATNSDPSHLARARRDYPETMNLFRAERTVASCDCGHRKPSREFFECLITMSGLPKAALCFIDDLPANVAGAQAAGISCAIHFRGDVAQLQAELAQRGVA
jgi:putative hydrolase of the HAD superfamily